MRIDEPAIKNFADALAAQGKQPATIESYCRDARQFVRFMAESGVRPENLDPGTLQRFQEHQAMSGMASENSVRRSVIGVRQFFRFLAGEKVMSRSPFDDAPIPDRSEKHPGSSDNLSLDAMMSAAISGGARIKGARDAAIIALLAYEGIKAGELIELRWRDVLFNEQFATLRIRGQRSRTITLTAKTEYLLRRYRTSYKEFMASQDDAAIDPHMFIAFKGRDGSKPILHMTRHGLKFVLYEIGSQTGVNHLNTELLRHHAVDFLLMAGKSPDEIMAHLGLRRMGNIKKHLTLQQPSSKDNDKADHDGGS